MRPPHPENLILLVDVAASYGVTVDGLKRALRRNNKPVYIVGNRTAATITSLEWYSKRREAKAPGVSARPHGWWGIKRAAEFLGVDISALHQMMLTGVLSGARYRHSYLFDPTELEVLRQKRPPVPVGWVQVRHLAPEFGMSRVGLAKRIHRLHIPASIYYEQGQGKGSPRCLCIREADAAFLRARWAA